MREFPYMKKRILSLLRRIEDRIFYAVFQSTRVTNDHYGWKPSQEHNDIHHKNIHHNKETNGKNSTCEDIPSKENL